jgi:diaminohydroxyphosphoribosylaminopyrimidine deaminase/5-amino-6-(5-phosphoribosylamino)uracil reductase
MSARQTDHLHMRLAIALARERLGATWPNPAVGCVIARGGDVLAQAATGPGGIGSAGHRLHAEEQALTDAGGEATGATAYVTLEPCAQRSSGRASCTDLLIAAGVARVAVACKDPSELASGQGLERLRAAGVIVDADMLTDEAADLYAGYWRRLATGRPLVEPADSGLGFDAPFVLAYEESLIQALHRLGEAGYTRLWVERGGILELMLRNQKLLN